MSEITLNCNSSGILTRQTIERSYTSVIVSNTCRILARDSLYYDWVTNITLPDTITTFNDDCFRCSIKYLFIPKSVNSIDLLSPFTYLQSCEKIDVDMENTVYTSIDGIIYSKDLSELVYCPPCNNLTVFKVPADVRIIWDQAFNFHKSLITMILTSPSTYIGDMVFYNVNTLKAFLVPYGSTFKMTPSTFKYSQFDPFDILYYLRPKHVISRCICREFLSLNYITPMIYLIV